MLVNPNPVRISLLNFFLLALIRNLPSNNLTAVSPPPGSD